MSSLKPMARTFVHRPHLCLPFLIYNLFLLQFLWTLGNGQSCCSLTMNLLVVLYVALDLRCAFYFLYCIFGFWHVFASLILEIVLPFHSLVCPLGLLAQGSLSLLKKGYRKRYILRVNQVYLRKLQCILHEEREENKSFVAFQILSLINRIWKLSSHLELHRKD